MKILMTSFTYYPRRSGVAVVTQYLAEGLVKKGHDVTIVTDKMEGMSDGEVHNGVKIRRIKMYTKYGFDFGDKRNYIKIIDEEAEKADVMVNVCVQNAHTNILLKRLDKYKCKKILYVHGMFEFGFRKIHFSSFKGTINKLWKEARWFFYYKLNGRYFKRYDLVIQLHEKDYGNNFFEKKYGTKSIIIENAADDAFFVHKESKDFKKPFDKYLILVANYDDGKNQKLAISEFLKSDIDSKIGLVLIGSRKNSYYDYLERYIKSERNKIGLSREEKPILLLYDIDRKHIPSYVSNAYLSLMTSKWEVFPVSIIESIVSGVPYISTDVGVVRYFFGGIVSKKNDIHYWIEKLVQNPKIHSELKKICKIYGEENFKIDDKVDLLEEEIEKLVQNGSKVGHGVVKR